MVVDRHGFHEPEPGGTWRPRARLHLEPAAAEPQSRGRLLAGSSASRNKLGAWTRAAAAWADWQGAKFARFGDNMREVAVTEGDKVSAQFKFGYSVNGYGVGDLVKRHQRQSRESEIDRLVDEYEATYEVDDRSAQERRPRTSSCAKRPASNSACARF